MTKDEFYENFEKPEVLGLIVGFAGLDPARKCELGPQGPNGDAAEFVMVSAGTGEVTVPAMGRKNVQPTFTGLPDGYTVVAYRQISLSGPGLNWQQCFIQTFATTGGGTKANISIYNGGTEDATLTVSCVALALKAQA